MISNQHINNFISRHQLPASFFRLIDEHYNSLTAWLIQKHRAKIPLFIGINGAQGTGKSTLADYLKLVLEEGEGWHVAVLSIDDFYMTRAERKQLSKAIHPLLLTRGVPGTHDLQLLSACIKNLQGLAAGEKLVLPRFDKAQDDRASIQSWPVATGPIDLIILEGWCVGSVPQAFDVLSQPINQLERDQDPTGKWRQYVNQQLEKGYENLFTELDFLLFLQAPNFEAVFRWRLEQEEKLAANAADNRAGIMDRAQISNFIQYFERLTRANFISLPKIADVTLELDDTHACIRSFYTS